MQPRIADAETALRAAIEQVLSGQSRRTLSDASRELTERYRGRRTGGPLVRSATDAAAYAAARLPATFAAVAAAARATAELAPEFAPTDLLDLGAGSGAASWAAAATWPGISRVRLVDADPEMMRVGRRLLDAAPRPGDWTWERGDIAHRQDQPHDLVIASYALGELEPPQRSKALSAAWAATAGMLLIVEPGTPAGFAVIRGLRDDLIGAGADLVAPCPHAAACPMTGGDWCHFAARVQRSTLHRQVKSADLSYEDEKFSYLVFAREPIKQAAARVLRHPARPPRKVDLVACTPTGLRRLAVPKSHPDYKAAKKLAWGSAIPDGML